MSDADAESPPQEFWLFYADTGYVTFASNIPGSHVTLFAPNGEVLPLCVDRCWFHDGERDYRWVFSHDRPLYEGDMFVFATTDRVRVGLVSGGEIKPVLMAIEVRRGPNGEPEGLL